ncbi:MAG TPA: hypothetical protein EYH02_06280 [Ignisphaera aggregans]|uniref:THUMP domain-containing protein n=1 Tax=Ignisphaera aggregans TaxID=334771 RepID=A0A832YYP9_9CREN|nr:hypothetical protein [Ignisphaera aggregans]
MVLALLFFEPYSRGSCLNQVVETLRSYGVNVTVLKDWSLRALIDVERMEVLYDVVRDVECVSRIAIVHTVISDRSIDNVVDAALSLIRDVFPGVRVLIDVRRWDKSYELTSVEIARRIARAVIQKGVAEPDPHERNNVIIVGIDKDYVYIAYSIEALQKHKASIPLTVVRRVVAIVDRLQTQYEIMDVIQLARAIGFELRLYKPNADEYQRVLKILNIDTPSNVRVLDDLDSVFKGIDIAIALSFYARENEAKLIKILKSSNSRVIGFVLGNEYSDVSEELRSRCNYTIRLGPISGMPMRTATALAYVLGLTLPVLAGYT